MDPTKVMPASPQPPEQYAPTTWWVLPLAGLLVPVTFISTLYGTSNMFAMNVGLLVAAAGGLTAFLCAASFKEQRQEGLPISEHDGRGKAYVFSVTIMLLTSLFMLVFGSSLPGPTAVEKPTYTDTGPVWTPPVTATPEYIPPDEDYVEPTEEVTTEPTPTPTTTTTEPPARTTTSPPPPPAEVEPPPPPVVPAPPPPAEPPVQQDPPPRQEPAPDPGIAPEEDPFGPPPF